MRCQATPPVVLIPSAEPLSSVTLLRKLAGALPRSAIHASQSRVVPSSRCFCVTFVRSGSLVRIQLDSSSSIAQLVEHDSQRRHLVRRVFAGVAQR